MSSVAAGLRVSVILSHEIFNFFLYFIFLLKFTKEIEKLVFFLGIEKKIHG
jgi:hypothetical protein